MLVLPSPDLVYKKRAGKTIFLKFILEKNFFSHKCIIKKDLCYLFHLIMIKKLFSGPSGVIGKADPGDGKPTYF